MKKFFALSVLGSCLLLGLGHPGQVLASGSVVVNFETPDVEPGDYTTDYTALEALGVTVVSAFGIVDDDGENWGITGNSGSQFIGVNGNPSDTLRLEFDSVYTGISLGCAVSNGNSAGDTLRLTLFDGADAVFTRGYTMADVDAWQALFSYGQYEFDAVEVVSLNPGPFGCDNLELDATALPETGTGAGSLVFWAAGLLALGSLLVRRRARA